MHRADEIIPRMPGGEFTDPILVAGQIIHFQREPDGELGKIPLRFADFFDVFGKLIQIHPPVVEIVLAHRRMVGEANFSQSDGGSLFCIFDRLAGCVAAERSVHMIIGGQRHASSFGF